MKSGFHSLGVFVSGECRSVVDIADVHYRLDRKQLNILDIFLIFFRHVGGAGVLHVLETFFVYRENLESAFVVFVTVFKQFLNALQLTCHEVEVAHLKLEVDEFHIAHRVDAALAMRDIRVIEAAQHMDESVDGLHLGEEFVTDALATLAQTRKVDDFDSGRHDTLRM